MQKRKKPFRINCPATLISVQHDSTVVTDTLPHLIKHFQPGKTLFIEFTEKEYSPICSLAEHMGMNVVNLSKNAATKIFLSSKTQGIPSDLETAFAAQELGFPPEKVTELGKSARFYKMGRVRERKWIIKLREANPGDVIVVNPNHAWRIAPLLGISRAKVAWFSHPSTERIREYKENLSKKKMKQLKELRQRLREQRKRETKKRQQGKRKPK